MNISGQSVKYCSAIDKLQWELFLKAYSVNHPDVHIEVRNQVRKPIDNIIRSVRNGIISSLETSTE